MKKLTGLDSDIHKGRDIINPVFEEFYFAPILLTDVCCINDPTHLVVKMFWRLIKACLVIGNQRASSAIISYVLREKGKIVTGVDPSIIMCNKDAMNYGRAEKVCQEKIIDLLIEDGQQATRTYMKMIMYIIEAYIDVDKTPEERIRKAWFVVFFCRAWRESVRLKQTTTIKNDFITSNAYACIEINAHNLIKFLIRCRQNNKPECFLPHLANSQTCESLFRYYRSMGSTNFTKINFNVFEMLHKTRRAVKLLHVPSEVSGHVFERTTASKSMGKEFVPTSLPNNDNIRRIITEALYEAKEDLRFLGEYYLK